MARSLKLLALSGSSNGRQSGAQTFDSSLAIRLPGPGLACSISPLPLCWVTRSRKFANVGVSTNGILSGMRPPSLRQRGDLACQERLKDAADRNAGPEMADDKWLLPHFQKPTTERTDAPLYSSVLSSSASSYTFGMANCTPGLHPTRELGLQLSMGFAMCH
jgi:hypothetical protein